MYFPEYPADSKCFSKWGRNKSQSNHFVPYKSGSVVHAMAEIVKDLMLGCHFLLSFIGFRGQNRAITFPWEAHRMKWMLAEVTEVDVLQVEEDAHPVVRAGLALENLAAPRASLQEKLRSDFPFLYWTIRDYAQAYKTGHTTPSEARFYFSSSVYLFNVRFNAQNFLFFKIDVSSFSSWEELQMF